MWPRRDPTRPLPGRRGPVPDVHRHKIQRTNHSESHLRPRCYKIGYYFTREGWMLPSFTSRFHPEGVRGTGSQFHPYFYYLSRRRGPPLSGSSTHLESDECPRSSPRPAEVLGGDPRTVPDTRRKRSRDTWTPQEVSRPPTSFHSKGRGPTLL